MGRLTLNVLLSFAQFEREVTAERIRDKIAASKKKGMWMGGLPPLGYDNRDKKLIVNQAEAGTVRRLFALYQEYKNVRLVKGEADRLGLRTKSRKPNNGRSRGSLPFTRGHLYKLLANPLYAGLIAHKGQHHDGLHAAIIDRETWDRVQVHLAESGVSSRSAKNTKSRHAFTGRIFDETGDRLQPHHASKKGRRYHYYVSSRLIATPGNPDPSGWRLPAKELDQAVIRIVIGWLENREALESSLLLPDAQIAERNKLAAAARLFVDEQKQDGVDSISVADLVGRIELAPTVIHIALDFHRLGEALNMSAIEMEEVVIDAPIALKRRGVEAKLVVGGDNAMAVEPDENLIEAIALARKWFADLQSGEAASVLDLADRHDVDRSQISRTLPLAFLAPDIVTKIIDGRTEPSLTLSRIKRMKLPASWQDQRQLLGIR